MPVINGLSDPEDHAYFDFLSKYDNLYIYVLCIIPALLHNHPSSLTLKRHYDLKYVQPSNAIMFLLINLKSTLHISTLKGLTVERI
jgi:hypothetical protein